MLRRPINFACLLSLLTLHNPTVLSFDRSAVETEIRYSPSGEYYRGDVEKTPPAVKVEYEADQFIARTKFGTYYGAAANPWFLKLLPRKNQDVFPLSKTEVQAKPEGISLNEARRAYKSSLPSPYAANGYKENEGEIRGWVKDDMKSCAFMKFFEMKQSKISKRT